MLTDPQTITVNAVAQSMPKVISDGTSSTYEKADGTFRLKVSHQTSKGRVRSLVRFEQRAVVADPLTAVNDYETLVFYVNIDRPEVGFSSTQCQQLIAGFQTWLNGTMVDKLYGRES